MVDLNTSFLQKSEKELTKFKNKTLIHTHINFIAAAIFSN